MVVGLGLGLLAASAVMLIPGAELFTGNVGAAARRLGITGFGAAFLVCCAEPEEIVPAWIALAGPRRGVALRAAGGWLAGGGAARVVAALRLTGSGVGLTLLALATTAELFALAWAAMRRGVSEIAVAGVVGSVA